MHPYLLKSQFQPIVGNPDAGRKFRFARLRQFVTNMGNNVCDGRTFAATSSAWLTLRCVGCGLCRNASMIRTFTPRDLAHDLIRHSAAIAQISDKFFALRAKTDNR